MTGRLIVTGRNSTLPQDVAQMTGGAIAIPHKPWKKAVGGFNFAKAEDALREHLEGKFFNVDGDNIADPDTRSDAEKRRDEQIARELKEEKERQEQIEREAEQTLKVQKATFSYTTMKAIMAAVSFAYCVPIGDIMSPSRNRRIAVARMHAIWLSKQLTDRSLPYIGKYFGRDHSTVIHAINEWPQRAPHYEREVSIVNEKLSKIMIECAT